MLSWLCGGLTSIPGEAFLYWECQVSHTESVAVEKFHSDSTCWNRGVAFGAFGAQRSSLEIDIRVFYGLQFSNCSRLQENV